MAAEDAKRIVLIAVDASEHSKRAFDYYLSSLIRENDYVILCHIAEQPKLASFSFKDGLNIPVEEWKKSVQESIDKATALEADYDQELIRKKIPHKMVKRTGKGPGQGICDVAKEENVSLIVMGSRGLNALRRTFMGSVSEYVLNHAGLPVLVIPPPKD